jgi:hypothetical protein
MGGNDIQQLNNLYFTTTNQSYIQGSGGNLSIVGNALAQIIVGAGSSVYTSIVQTTTTLDELQTGGAGYIRRTAAGNIIDIATGNIQTQATSTINTVAATLFTGAVSRTLRGTNIQQPIIQYGLVSTSGASGTVTVNLPTTYTTQTSYLPFAVMADAPAAQTFVSSISRGSFIIGWQGGSGGSQQFNWQTLGV